MKDNFLLKKEFREIFKALSHEDAGKLSKGIFDYVCTGDSGLDGYLKVIFIPIQKEIDKNEENYQKKCEINRVNGSKGGAPKSNQNAKKTIETSENKRAVIKTTENKRKQHDSIHSHISPIINHNSIEDSNRGMGKEKEISYGQEFELLWKIYPNKKGKSQAMQKYSLARKQGVTYEEVRQGLESYIKYCKIENIEQKFIKHGSTWFNQQCWKDEYEVTRKPTTKDVAKVIDWKEYSKKYGS